MTGLSFCTTRFCRRCDLFKRGFTLIEMLLVLIILAGATSLVFPYLSGLYEKTRFKAEVREISALFRQIRNKAIVEKKIFCIQIHLEERLVKYGIYEGAQFKEKGSGNSYELPGSIKKVSYFADGREYFTGKAWFVFYSLGNSGGGELRFYGPKRHSFDMSLKPITGAITLD
jgi:prepilin-type N-terminal cleavage/methylation domain-containing protein